MGVELQNSFARGLYCGNAGSDPKCQMNGSIRDGGSLNHHSQVQNVKQCLKSKVIGSLRSRGYEHVVADFSPKPCYPMSPEEVVKDQRRRQCNRNSARKCRERQKQEDSKNKKLLAQLKKEKEKLLEIVQKTEEEKNKLLFNLKLMLPDSYITEALKSVPEITKVKERALPEQYSDAEEVSSIDSPNSSGKYISEETFPDGIYVLPSSDDITDEGPITGIVNFIEIAGEETVQVIDFNYDENTKIHLVYDDQCASETLI